MSYIFSAFAIAKYFSIRQWCVRVIFVGSESNHSHKPFESESSQSHDLVES